MPGKITFEIKGAKELERLLRELGQRAANRIGDRAVKAAARVVAKEAKRRVPVRTGALRDSITVVTRRKTEQNERIASVAFKQPAGSRAHLTEFGTAHSAARPFLRPAFDATVNEALEEMGKVAGKAIVSEAMKMAKKVR